MKELLYKKSEAVAALNRVDGFHPMELARKIGEEGQEEQLYLDVKYRKLWFRLVNPAGKIISRIITFTENMAVVEARIYGEYYLLILVGGYIVTMFCAALTMLVTVKMHTPNLAICIPFFLLCMMPFIARVLPAFDAFFNLLPTVLTNIFNAVRTPILFQIGSFVFRQISLLMFLYILLFIVLLPLIYIGYSRYGLKKK